MSIRDWLFRLSCPLIFLTLSRAAMCVNVASPLLISPQTLVRKPEGLALQLVLGVDLGITLMSTIFLC